MQTRQLGTVGPKVSALSLGCMGMSAMYGHADEAESTATIEAAIDAGVTLLDTGDFYGQGHNEMLIGRTIRGRNRDSLVISVKFGAMRGPDGSWIGFDSRPPAMKNFLAYSLKRLGVDHIDIYRPARLDPRVPIEETIGAMADMVKAGYVRYLGLSEVGVETIRRAHKIHPICDLQIEYAIISRSPEAEIFPALRELGIGVTAYGVLSRGLLSGSKPGASDGRSHFPRFVGENFEQNQKLVKTLHDLAAAKGLTGSQLAIAWVLAKSEAIVPVIGARTRRQLSESLAALSVTLTAADISQIEQAIPPDAIVGTRYAPEQMKVLDSEKKVH